MRTNIFSRLAPLIFVIANVVVPSSFAGTGTGTLLVSATVLSTCLVVSTPVAFGNYALAQIDTTGTITVTCTADVNAYNVALGTGLAAGSTTSTRKLTSGVSNTLNYELFTDSARSVNWGNIPNTDTVLSTASTSGSGAIKTFTAYARMPANQTSYFGVYTDSVAITVNF